MGWQKPVPFDNYSVYSKHTGIYIKQRALEKSPNRLMQELQRGLHCYEQKLLRYIRIKGTWKLDWTTSQEIAHRTKYLKLCAPQDPTKPLLLGLNLL